MFSIDANKIQYSFMMSSQKLGVKGKTLILKGHKTPKLTYLMLKDCFSHRSVIRYFFSPLLVIIALETLNNAVRKNRLEIKK